MKGLLDLAEVGSVQSRLQRCQSLFQTVMPESLHGTGGKELWSPTLRTDQRRAKDGAPGFVVVSESALQTEFGCPILAKAGPRQAELAGVGSKGGDTARDAAHWHPQGKAIGKLKAACFEVDFGAEASLRYDDISTIDLVRAQSGVFICSSHCGCAAPPCGVSVPPPIFVSLPACSSNFTGESGA